MVNMLKKVELLGKIVHAYDLGYERGKSGKKYTTKRERWGRGIEDGGGGVKIVLVGGGSVY